MAEISAKDVKALRDRTGAGMMDCKRALQESEGDVDSAIEWLRKKGIAGAAKLGSREATEGTVQSYIHANRKIGVLVEVDCNTDFTANTDDVVGFARDVALHIAAANPLYISEEDVPEDVSQAELRSTRSRRPTSPRTCARGSRRASCASGSRTSCCSSRRT